jgi:hypothetical protein
MKKVYLVVSFGLYIGFLIPFVLNIIDEFDVFYIAWGTIAFPIAIVLLRKDIKYNNTLLIGLLILICLYLLDMYVFVAQQDPFGMPIAEPGPTLLNIAILLLGVILLGSSYLLLIINYKEYDKIQYILYATMIVLFFASIAVFLKCTVLEYTLGIVLFIVLTTNFVMILHKSLKRPTI